MTEAPAPAARSGLPQWVYVAMLFATTIMWGGGFVAMKDVVEGVGPSTLVGLRFAVAALCMLVLFGRRIRANATRQTVAAGLVLGTLYFMGFWTQTVGLADTTPGKNAFLTATYVVMVPFVYWVVSRTRPTAVNVGSAVVCLVGIGLVSLAGGEGLQMGFGDAMTLVCAVFYAVHIALLGKFAIGIDMDPYFLAFIQFATCGVLGCAIGFATEPWPDPAFFFRPDILAQFAFAALACSLVACLFQNVAQKHVPPSQASLIMGLESVFGVLFSVVLYGEVLTGRMVVGFALILVAVAVGEGLNGKELPWGRKKRISC